MEDSDQRVFTVYVLDAENVPMFRYQREEKFKLTIDLEIATYC